MSLNDTSRNKGKIATYLEVDDETSSGSSNKKRRLDSAYKMKRKNKRNYGSDLLDDQVISTSDQYCWICHGADSNLRCQFCPRYFHSQCIQLNYYDASLISYDGPSTVKPINFSTPIASSVSTNEYICPECVMIMLADCHQFGKKNIFSISSVDLREIMLYIVLRLFYYTGEADDSATMVRYYKALHFHDPVEDKYKDNNKMIKNPMCLKFLKQNIEEDKYTSLQQFFADFKWIYHNCTIYNGDNHTTSCARNLTNLCSKEINFIESCPQCFKTRLPYMVKLLREQDFGTGKLKMNWKFSFDNVPVQKNWITELCDTVHPLVWVRLQGYPTWPGKLLTMDEENALVLFFGDYDLNIVPVGSMCMHSQSNSKQLSLLCNNSFSNQKDNNNVSSSKTHQSNIDMDFAPSNPIYQGIFKEYRLALEQMQMHIDNIKLRYPSFVVPTKKYENNINRGIEYYRRIIRKKSGINKTATSATDCGNIIANGNSSDAFTNGVVKSTPENMLNLDDHSDATSTVANIKRNEKTTEISHKAVKRPLSIPSENSADLIDQPHNRKYKLTTAIESFETKLSNIMTQFKKEYLESLDYPAEYSNGGNISTAFVSTNSNSGNVKKKSKMKSILSSEGDSKNTGGKLVNEMSVLKQENPDKQALVPVITGKSTVDTETNTDNTYKNDTCSSRSNELWNYIKYLEDKLAMCDVELHRQELLGTIRSQEHLLESLKQQMEMRRLNDADLKATVLQSALKFKRKEWCAFCGKSALFYCCWNTCYCNTECQAKHWMIHKSTCTQVSKKIASAVITTNNSANSSRNNSNSNSTVSVCSTITSPVVRNNNSNSSCNNNHNVPNSMHYHHHHHPHTHHPHHQSHPRVNTNRILVASHNPADTSAFVAGNAIVSNASSNSATAVIHLPTMQSNIIDNTVPPNLSMPSNSFNDLFPNMNGVVSVGVASDSVNVTSILPSGLNNHSGFLRNCGNNRAIR